MIEHIFIISFFTIGYCCTFWPGMIFEHVGDWLEIHLPEWLNKPTWQCYICTCFWLGSLLYWFMWHKDLVDWFVTVVAAMGVNAFVSELVNKEKEVEVTSIPDVKIVPEPAQQQPILYCHICMQWKKLDETRTNTELIFCNECDSYLGKHNDSPHAAFEMTNQRLFTPCVQCGALNRIFCTECGSCGADITI